MNGKRDFDTVRQRILECRLCKQRFGFEPHPIVFGNGGSKIVQISQAPSRHASISLKPFDDISGKRLRQDWYRIADKVFYNPDNFCICGVAQCYPGKSVHGGDRLPPKICAETWLSALLDSVNNEIYILLGGKASEFFFPGENFTSLVFRDAILRGKPAYVLPHPSPLNSKWLKDNPRFVTRRLPEIRKVVHAVLQV